MAHNPGSPGNVMNPKGRYPGRTARISFILFIMAIAGSAPLSCRQDGGEPATATQPKEVRLHLAKSRDYSAEIESFGTVLFTHKSDVASAVEGNVEKIECREGDRVRRGQTVAVLFNPQFSIRLDQAKAAAGTAAAAAALADARYSEWRRKTESLFLSVEKKEIEISRGLRILELAETGYRDKKQLFDVGGVPGETMRTARSSVEDCRSSLELLGKELEIANIGLRDEDLIGAGYAVPADPLLRRNLLVDLNSSTQRRELEVARANERSAQIELSSALALVDELTIESPIDGTVGALYKEAGERVGEGEKVITVFGSQDIWVAFPVHEENLSGIKPGMEALIHLDALQDAPIRGKIDMISPTVDPQSGNFTVKAIVRGVGDRAKPGMFARVKIATERPTKKILIPVSCLMQRNGNEGTVMAFRSGKVFRRKVISGIEYRDELEIREGLTDGERIVLEPTPLLGEGDSVSVRE